MSVSPSWFRTSAPFLMFVAAIGVRLQAQQPPATISPPSVQRAAEMQHHFVDVAALHDAVARGDLASVTESARRLAGMALPAAVPLSAIDFVARIREAAQHAAVAPSVAGATSQAVEMLKQCAGCHVALGVHPSPAPRPGPDVGGIVGHMLDHQHAANEMLRGLVIPSEALWLEGADRLSRATMRSKDVSQHPGVTAAAMEAERDVHTTAARATAAHTLDERAAVYTQVLSSCATCHNLHPRVWGPGTTSR